LSIARFSRVTCFGRSGEVNWKMKTNFEMKKNLKFWRWKRILKNWECKWEDFLMITRKKWASQWQIFRH
jgi:hypothetical protein